jgi:hypothetical protein
MVSYTESHLYSRDAYIRDRYMYWRQLFPEEIREHARIQDGFRRGLDLMNQTIA